jgi:hypothetical protein
MNLNFKLLDGTEYLLKIEDDITMEEIKKLLEKKIHIYWKRINLIFCGRCLSNQDTIKETNIKTETMIHVIYIDEQEYWQEQYKDSISRKNTKLKKEQTPEHTSLWSSIFSHCCCEERTPQRQIKTQKGTCSKEKKLT